MQVARALMRPLVTSAHNYSSFRLVSGGGQASLFESGRDPKSEKKIVYGRSWKASELRLKSWDDLHKLWYVFLKEKNMLLLHKQMLLSQSLRIPNPKRWAKGSRGIGVQVAAGREEGEEPQEAVPERWSLEELDKQLKVLESRESSAPRQIPGNQQSAANGGKPLAQWPNFSTGFFAYLGIGLMILTVVNNVLYKLFLGPPVADRREAFVSSVPVRPKFRVTTRQEESEAREAEAAQIREAEAAQIREAPLPSD